MPETARRILFVDDQDRSLVTLQLRELGFEVDVAEDGLIAKEMFEQRGPYNFLRTDHSMPRQNGEQLLTYLLENRLQALQALAGILYKSSKITEAMRLLGLRVQAIGTRVYLFREDLMCETEMHIWIAITENREATQYICNLDQPIK
jgi:CheY-like chemotaxis protein